MGLNISGTVIQNNFEGQIQKLSENLEIGLEVIEQDAYYDSSTIDKDHVFVLFTEKATLIIYEQEIHNQAWYSQTDHSLNFQYYETGMIFALRYIKACETIRQIVSIDGDTTFSTGRKIRAELGAETVDQVITHLIHQMAGLDIYSFHSNYLKCKLVDYTGKRSRKSEEEIHAMLTEQRISRGL